MNETEKIRVFEKARPQLMGIAYRLLGTIADAEDAVQDTGLKWLNYSGPPLDEPAAWLVKVCTNRCLDILKSAHRTRLDYVGPWLPDHLHTETEGDAEAALEFSGSLNTAFLLLLDRLTPKERAAYLLHDIFGKPFDEVAGILGLSAPNCRQLAVRARKFIQKGHARQTLPADKQTELLSVFQQALETGDTRELGLILSADADLRADSGGKVIAVRDVLSGREMLADFISGILHPAWSGSNIEVQSINGSLGLRVTDNGAAIASISFAFDTDGRIEHVFIMRNPDKLVRTFARTGRFGSDGALHIH